MRLATARLPHGLRAVRVDADGLVDLEEPDLGAFLARPDWRERAQAAEGTRHAVGATTFAPVIPQPTKVICVGLNYRGHILEMGRPLPEFPTMFSKFADTLIGASDTIALPPETNALDWEGELAVVIGAGGRRLVGPDAEAAIAGFTVANDITCRDWQNRTPQWDQGKAWDSSTPVGPWLVTPDELPGGVRPGLRLVTRVNDVVMQDETTTDLVFDPVALIEYASTIVRLRPGDLVLTGTPAGVGHARTPAVHLVDGDVVEVSIDGLGTVRNVVRLES